MGRSTKKGPFVSAKLLEKVHKLNASGEKKVIKTWSRACVITPEFVGHTFAVHNGRKFLDLYRSRWSAIVRVLLTRFLRPVDHGSTSPPKEE